MTKETVEVIIDINETDPEVTAVVENHPEVESFVFDDLPAADLAAALLEIADETET